MKPHTLPSRASTDCVTRTTPAPRSSRTASGSLIARATLALAITCLAPVTQLAAQPAPPPRLEPLPEVPPPPRPANAQEMEKFEPQVTTRQENGNRIEEYRVNGRIYAIRVTPPIGKPYVMVDKIGKGNMTRMDDISGGVSPPQWVLFEF